MHRWLLLFSLSQLKKKNGASSNTLYTLRLHKLTELNKLLYYILISNNNQETLTPKSLRNETVSYPRCKVSCEAKLFYSVTPWNDFLLSMYGLYTWYKSSFKKIEATKHITW